MLSNIKNRNNQQVEQLSNSSVIMHMDHTGALLPNDFIIPNLKQGFQYEINRCTLVFTQFVETGGAVVKAYPKFEQFNLQIFIKGMLGIPGGPFRILFQQLQWSTSDGITNYELFREPFIFQTYDSNDQNLFLECSDNNSDISSLSASGFTIPPGGIDTISLLGTITLEGISYAIPAIGSAIK